MRQSKPNMCKNHCFYKVFCVFATGNVQNHCFYKVLCVFEAENGRPDEDSHMFSVYAAAMLCVGVRAHV